MKVLAIDTSCETCSVSILEDNYILKELNSDGNKQHSVNLMPMIDEIFRQTNLSLDNIDVLGCGIGPGSFTGVRIGIATIKAFSDAKNIPIVGINSLEAQAYYVALKNKRKDCKIVSMIDAKNDNLYFAVYRIRNGNLSVYKNPETIDISQIIDYFNFTEPVYIVGNVEKKRIDSLIQATREEERAQGKDVSEYEYIKAPQNLADEIAIATMEKYNIGAYGNSNSIMPMYLQRPQAERQKDGEGRIYVLEMGKNDVQEIKDNYEKFPNIWDKRTFEEDTKNSKYYVAKLDNEIVGFIAVRNIFDELEIMNLVTREDKRKNGIASNLLSNAIRKYSDCKINLEVNENNYEAKNIYYKFGFRKVGERPRYYNGENAIVMSLK